MRTPSIHTGWTAERVRNELIREDRPWPRYEFIDGEVLATPAPRSPHQIAAARLLQEIGPYTRRNRIGLTLSSPADISLGGDAIVQPDVFVIPAAQSRAVHLARRVVTPARGRRHPTDARPRRAVRRVLRAAPRRRRVARLTRRSPVRRLPPRRPHTPRGAR